MSNVAKIETIEHLPATITPMDMIQRAVASGAGMDVVEKLMNLQERWEASQSRKAFNEAIAAAKAEIKPVMRTQSAHNSKYADLASIAEAIDPIISKHGLGYRYRSAQADRISVTCILFHKLGHSEETTLIGPADKTGSKNEIQAIGSTLTYLQRYSLILALGLATAKDDDGRAATAGETITDEQVDEISKLLIETKSNLTLFLKTIKLESLTEISASKFDNVMTLIRTTAKKRAEREAAMKGQAQ